MTPRTVSPWARARLITPHGIVQGHRALTNGRRLQVLVLGGELVLAPSTLIAFPTANYTHQCCATIPQILGGVGPFHANPSLPYIVCVGLGSLHRSKHSLHAFHV